MIVNANWQEGGLWLIFVVAAFLVVVVFIVIGYVQRLALLAIVTVAAPFALACHALPGLDRLAAWWWRVLAATLGAQFAQALTFVVAVRVFLAPGALGGSGAFAEPVMRIFLTPWRGADHGDGPPPHARPYPPVSSAASLDRSESFDTGLVALRDVPPIQ